MDPSTSLNDLQTFLGMIQFLSRFIPNLASVAAVLCDLTKSSSEFQWNPEQQEAVAEIKRMITSPGSLQSFDVNKPVTIQVDDSTRGLGATLLPDKGPVEYRSKRAHRNRETLLQHRARDARHRAWPREISLLCVRSARDCRD